MSIKNRCPHGLDVNVCETCVNAKENAIRMEQIGCDKTFKSTELKDLPKKVFTYNS